MSTDLGTYTGRLRKGQEPGTVEGWLEDRFGWRIALKGRLDPASGDYVLEGVLGNIPAALRVPVIDEETP